MIGKIFCFFKNAQQLGKFTRLVREVGEPFSPSSPGKFDLSGKKNRDPLQELAEMMSMRSGAASVFNDYDITNQNRKGELVRLFHMLIMNGAGQWVADEFVPTAVLYDVDLLRLVLQVERSDSSNVGEKMAILALKHVEKRISDAA